MAGGSPLRLAREYIQHGIRQHAEDLCTAQLGYRTSQDMAEARAREADQQRFTSLDRVLSRHRSPDALTHFQVALPIGMTDLLRRLHVLRTMGLAEQIDAAHWRIRNDFEHVLRSMQKVGDRQKMLAANATLLSDQRLPIQVTSVAQINRLEGRVLAHVLDDSTGRVHMLLEATDGRVHFIAHDNSIESARGSGRLKPNSFVQLTKRTGDSKRMLHIKDFGDADDYLTSGHLKNTARRLVQRGVIPTEPVWGGWLGQYHAALRQTAQEPFQDRARGR